jgi:biotin operon repressor
MLDACYDLRTGTGATTAGTPNRMEQFGDAAIVGRTIDDEPHSIGELDDSLELSQTRIENALDMLVDVGAAAERDGYYHATLEDRGLTEALQNTPSQLADRANSIPERLIRPFRLFDS